MWNHITVILLAVCLLLFLLLFIFFFIIFKFGYVKNESKVRLTGKTAVVTGGSSGIGYEIVLALAEKGCKIIIADILVNENIKQSIVNKTNNPNIILEYVDFASFKSVRKFASKLKETEEKVDILINNVGIGKCTDELTEDGLNKTMEINYYSPFLLTHLLIDPLKKSKQGRIIFTASVASFLHLLTRRSVTADKIKDLPSLLRYGDYNNSKFLTVTSSLEFAEKLQKWNITCNVYHPGIAKSRIYDQALSKCYTFLDIIFGYSFIFYLPNIFGIDTKKASQAAVELAVSEKFTKVTGIFFGKFFPELLPRLASDWMFRQRIWQASEKIVQLKPEEKLE